MPLALCYADWELPRVDADPDHDPPALPLPPPNWSTFAASSYGATIGPERASQLSWTTRLAASLLNDQDAPEASPRSAYSRVLPREFATLPHRMDEDLFAAEAQSRKLEAVVDAQYFRAASLQNELVDALVDAEEETEGEDDSPREEDEEEGIATSGATTLARRVATHPDFAWAVDTVQSRTFLIGLGGNTHAQRHARRNTENTRKAQTPKHTYTQP